jgi:hypothetical protein
MLTNTSLDYARDGNKSTAQREPFNINKWNFLLPASAV